MKQPLSQLLVGSMYGLVVSSVFIVSTVCSKRFSLVCMHATSVLVYSLLVMHSIELDMQCYVYQH
jgi:hypothetical protein